MSNDIHGQQNVHFTNWLFVGPNFIYRKNKNHEGAVHSTSLSLADIMPKPQRLYDKNKAPKLLGQPTIVYFHVTGNIPLSLLLTSISCLCVLCVCLFSAEVNNSML